MTVGVLNVRLAIRQATSLKDKRRVVQSILQRTRQHFNVCAIESGARDARQDARLGFAALAQDRSHAESTLTQVVNAIQQRRDAELVDFEIETF